MAVFAGRASGEFATIFWTMVVLNVVVPLGVLPFAWGRKPLATALVGLGVLVGMWIERFLIVVGTLSLPRLDFTVGSYQPTWVEMGILLGSMGLFALLYFLFVQFAPIVSIWEVREGERHAKLAGGGERAADPGHAGEGA